MIWLRADASASIGMGHLMRCIALAEAIEALQAQVTLVVGADRVAQRVAERSGFPVLAAEAGWLDVVGGNDTVVFDGYAFTIQDHRDARRRGAHIAAVTDLSGGTYDVDLLLNQNPPGPELDYDVPDAAEVLLGPGYALVREEFRHLRRHRTGDLRTIVVTLGGSDVARLTPMVVAHLLMHHANLHVVALVGPAASEAVDRIPHARGRLTVVTDPPRVSEVFDAADAAISAAGSTTWELLTLGVPTALIQVADNQWAIGPRVRDAGAGLFLGVAPVSPYDIDDALCALADPSTRARLSRRALRMVDGHGASRVARLLLER